MRSSFCIFCCLALAGSVSAGPKMDGEAKAMAGMLPVHSFNKPGNPDGAAHQMVRIIERLENGKNGMTTSKARSVMAKAADFKKEQMGRSQATQVTNTIVSVWEAADRYGAFDENGKFTHEASKGRHNGDKLVFQPIIPKSLMPKAQGYLGNLELVPASLGRDPDAPVDYRTQARLSEFQRIAQESYSLANRADKYLDRVTKTDNKMGQSAKEVEALYQEAVKQAGEKFNEVPQVRIRTQFMSRPSKLNDNRYRVDYQITNLSGHATEVDVEMKIIGYTDKHNRLYIMSVNNQKLKMRGTQSDQFQVWTKPVGNYAGAVKELDDNESSRVIYRGHIVQVFFRGELIGSHGSDARMRSLIESQESIPRF
ncbi:MAG: hypothetical protein AAF226_02850 [Verrucomicrobiota bacterium]